MACFSLNDLKTFLLKESSPRYWMGVDVHKNSYHVALLSETENLFTWSAPASGEQLLELIIDFNIPVAGICHESGPTGFSFARLLQDAELPIVVAAPSKIPRSVSAGSKTDRLDCIKLARYASKQLIRSIAVPTPTEEYERALLRRREQVVDELRRSKQRIKAMFLFHGFKSPSIIEHWCSGSAEALRALELPSAMKMTLESHVRELEYLQTELSILTTQLKVISGSPDHQTTTEALKSVPGVGDVVAATFLLEIFNPRRFNNKEEIASYLGLAPTVRHSGEKTPRGHLVPVGQKRLRSLLVEAAWVWRSRDEYAHRLYNKFYSHTGITQKAITALARKLAIILWRLSIEQRAYRPIVS